MTKLTKLAADLEPFMIDLINKVVGDHAGYGADADNLMLGNVIRIRGTTVDLFDGDDDGFETANTGANSGDVILLPPLTFTSSLTITAGAKIVGWSRFTTNLSGQITMGNGSSLEKCSVVRSASSGSVLKGVLDPASGTAYLGDVSITVTNSGAGGAYGISLESGGTIQCWSVYSYGDAAGGGVGESVHRAAGTLIVLSNWFKGSTRTFSE